MAEGVRISELQSGAPMSSSFDDMEFVVDLEDATLKLSGSTIRTIIKAIFAEGGDIYGALKIHNDLTVTGSVTSNSIESDNYDAAIKAGFKLFKDNNGRGILKVNKIEAEELVVDVFTYNKIQAVGGTIVISQAWSDVSRTELNEDGSYTFYYQPDDLLQIWRVGDQPRMASGGRYFWGVITECSESQEAAEHSFTCSPLEANIIGTPSNVKEGDTFVLYGHRGSDATRTNVTVISSGTSDNPYPAITQYFNITSFDLSDTESKKTANISYDTTIGVIGARIKWLTDKKEIHILGDKVYFARDEESTPTALVQEMGAWVEGAMYFANQRVTLPKGTLYLCVAPDGTTSTPSSTDTDNWLLQSTDYDGDIALAAALAAKAKEDAAAAASDGVLTPAEKATEQSRLAGINSEYTENTTQAGTYSVPYIDYTNAYNALKSYLTNTADIYDTSENTTIDRATFEAYYNSYYDERQDLLEAIVVASKGYVDDITVGTTNIISNSNTSGAFSGSSAGGTTASTLTQTVVSEFGFTDANRVISSGGDGYIKAIKVLLYNSNFEQGRIFSYSFYIKNNGDNRIRVNTNGYDSGIYLDGGEELFVKGENKTRGYNTFQIQVCPVNADNTADVASDVDFTWSRIMVVEGTKVGSWALTAAEIDSAIKAAKTTAEAAAIDAAKAKVDAAAAASDGILTPAEKATEQSRLTGINSEYTENTTQAGTYSVPYIDYTNAYNALKSYLTNTADIYDTSENTTINRATFEAYYNSYYDERQDLLEAIVVASKGYVEYNLLDDSAKGWTNNYYPTASIYLGDYKPSAGEEVTIVVKGEIGDVATCYGLFNSGGSVFMGYIYKTSFVDGFATLTFDWRTISSGGTVADNTHIKLYPMNTTSSNRGTNSIEWVKLVRGSKTSLSWCASANDQAKEPLKSLVSTAADIDAAVEAMRGDAPFWYDVSTGRCYIETAYIKKAIVSLIQAGTGEFDSLKANNGTFTDATITGSVKGVLDLAANHTGSMYDTNIAYLTRTPSSSYTLPHGGDVIGRVIKIRNSSSVSHTIHCPKFNINASGESLGADSSITPEYFLNSGDTIEMTCYSTPVLSDVPSTNAVSGGMWDASNLFLSSRRGNNLSVLAFGAFGGTSASASATYETYDGTTMTFSRLSSYTGRYKISFPSAWKNEAKAQGLTWAYYVMLTGRGFSLDDPSQNSPIKASWISMTDTSFTVVTSDDATANDGYFNFQIINMSY